MIVASTDYDNTTVVLQMHARSFQVFAGAACTFLAKATAEAIEQSLNDSPDVPFFFFGHGEPPPKWGFVAQDGKPAATSGKEALLGRRTVVASCCHGEQMGPRLQPLGTQMLGYTDVLWVPDVSVGPVMDDAILAGPKAVASGRSMADAAAEAQSAFRTLARTMLRRGDGLFLFMSINADRVSTW